MKKQPRQTGDSAFFRSNVGINLLDILDNAQEIRNKMNDHLPKTTKPFNISLGNRTGEYISYYPDGGINAYFRDEGGVLYEISVFKR